MKKSVEERLSQHDKDIAAIRRLMLQGMKLLVRSEKRTDNLMLAVTKLEKQVNRLVRSLEHGRNGKAA